VFCLKNEKVKAILFDLGGTIFDIIERDAYARYKALNELGYDISLDEVRQCYHYGIGRLGPVEELGIEVTEKQEEAYIKASFAHFTESEALNLTRIHNGAHNVLRTLSKRFRLAIVTSRDALSSTKEELDNFDIRRFFTLIVTREVAAKYHGVKEIPLLPFEEQRKKLYECVIGLIRMDPKDFLCIGDSVGELLPAKKLGIRVIGVLTGFSDKEDMEKASIPTIQDLSQLLKILS
jgi:phosphoglycolate phosphatase-like HAD superfamily hydrolase